MNEIRVGLLGLGTIGTGVARILLEQQELMTRRLGKTIRLVEGDRTRSGTRFLRCQDIR